MENNITFFFFFFESRLKTLKKCVIGYFKKSLDTEAKKILCFFAGFVTSQIATYFIAVKWAEKNSFCTSSYKITLKPNIFSMCKHKNLILLLPNTFIHLCFASLVFFHVCSVSRTRTKIVKF